jgi:hypothetical protein
VSVLLIMFLLLLLLHFAGDFACRICRKNVHKLHTYTYTRAHLRKVLQVETRRPRCCVPKRSTEQARPSHTTCAVTLTHQHLHSRGIQPSDRSLDIAAAAVHPPGSASCSFCCKQVTISPSIGAAAVCRYQHIVTTRVTSHQCIKINT